MSEHQPPAWSTYFLDLHCLVYLFPAGLFFLFHHLRDEHIFVVIYAVMASYFSGVMVRLILTLTPCVCVCAALATSALIDVYAGSPVGSEASRKNGRTVRTMPLEARMLVLGCVGIVLEMFILHSTLITSSAYSSPSVVLASQTPDGNQVIIDDFREAYYWLRENTPQDAKVMSWWDYGYQIAGFADRTTLVDNNTWNNTHIATVGKAMASSEERAYPILRKHDVDYVLIIFGGLLGYSGDDLNKFLWMIRISQGLWPDEIQEHKFFSNGEYRVDDQASATMRNCLMYKMSYHRYNDLFGGRAGMDRARNAMGPSTSPTLDTLDEVFTSENWLVRIYQVKKEDTLGRPLPLAHAFEQGKRLHQAPFPLNADAIVH